MSHLICYHCQSNCYSCHNHFAFTITSTTAISLSSYHCHITSHCTVTVMYRNISRNVTAVTILSAVKSTVKSRYSQVSIVSNHCPLLINKSVATLLFRRFCPQICCHISKSYSCFFFLNEIINLLIQVPRSTSHKGLGQPLHSYLGYI